LSNITTMTGYINKWINSGRKDLKKNITAFDIYNYLITIDADDSYNFEITYSNARKNKTYDR